MDFDALRARALNAGGEEEAVTVNTRALIDKVLARYSSKWTVLRELVANAADAGATKVTVRFQTSKTTHAASPSNNAASLEHAIRHSTLHRLEVTNNGSVFAATDWKRLKSIAEGNPDEQKIGAFGVGFYSVFADCENPLVLSGNQGLDFYWKGNALFTRKLQLTEYRADTSFVMDYRDSNIKVPDMVDLYQFLATSLTFANLKTIEVRLNDWNLLVLTKDTIQSLVGAVPKGINATTKGGMMRVTEIQRDVVKMSARWSYPITRDPSQNALHAGPSILSTSTATVHLRTVGAHISTTLTAQFAAEIERATKKLPPKKTKLAILRPFGASAFASGEADPLGIFDSVIPSKAGRIFIGFPTHQTTGLLVHISLNSVIPTVERESIDLNARWVRDWNEEILRVAGTAARIAWNDEMRSLKQKIEQTTEPNKEEALAEATQIFERFAFKDATPYSRVGQIIQETFWEADREPISVYSSHGVLPSHKVRIAPDGVAGFINGIPILPEQIIKIAGAFVNGLKSRGFASDMSITDIKKELTIKSLNNEQLLELLKWVQKKAVTNLEDAKTVLQSAHALVRETGNNMAKWIVFLRSVKYYVNDDIIPSDLPVDLDTMPVTYTKIFAKSELHKLGWQELPLKEWVRFLVSASPFPTQCRIGFPNANIFRSPEFAGNVLRIISKRWSYTTANERETIVSLLRPNTVIPTKLGMMTPPKSYLSSVTLFHDLANVKDVEGVSETVLLALGVQKMVELGMVLKRLKYNTSRQQNSTQNTVVEAWSFADLVNYLTTVSSQLTPQDWLLLRHASICHAEGDNKELCKVSDLYEPAETLRNLGLKVLDWPGTYRPGGKEDAFLRTLGLKQFPSVLDIVQIIAKAINAGNKALIDRALGYFITSFAVNKYQSFERWSIRTAYLPLEGESGQYSSPARCFTSEGAALMGYSILRKDLHSHASKFGVEADPPISWCITRLTQHRPRSIKDAVAIFSYLGCRKPSDLEDIGEHVSGQPFVPISSSPVADGATATISRYVSPRDCFLGDPRSFSTLFNFINFGHDGNRFLRRCGAHWEPTPWDVGYRFVRQPHMLLEMLTGTPENYKYWLQWLASRSQDLQRDPQLWELMKTSGWLLGAKQEGDQQRMDNHLSSGGGAAVSREAYVLKKAADIVIVDDIAAYRCFRDKLCTAPRNHTLEHFYIELGSEPLSKLLEVIHNFGADVNEPLAAKKMETLVVERASFFLSEINPENIKVSSTALKEGLTVKAVSYISMRRILRGYGSSTAESVTAAVMQGDSSTKWTLCFTPGNIRMHDVSASIVQLLLHRPTLNSQLSLDGLLAMDVGALESYGYDVSRILVAQLEEYRISEDQRRKNKELKAKLEAEYLSPITAGTIPASGALANDSSVTQTLSTAIAASRPFKALNISSVTSSEQLKEAANSTYCDVRPGHDLALAASPSTSPEKTALPMFLPPSLIRNKNTWLRAHADCVTRFAAILVACAKALGAAQESLHIFFEEKGKTSAFNSNGSLFFNLRMFEDMSRGAVQNDGKEMERYWLVVLCHEVAHNLIKGHGPEHGFWTETLIIKNIGKLEGNHPRPILPPPRGGSLFDTVRPPTPPLRPRPSTPIPRPSTPFVNLVPIPAPTNCGPEPPPKAFPYHPVAPPLTRFPHLDDGPAPPPFSDRALNPGPKRPDITTTHFFIEAPVTSSPTEGKDLSSTVTPDHSGRKTKDTKGPTNHQLKVPGGEKRRWGALSMFSGTSAIKKKK